MYLFQMRIFYYLQGKTAQEIYEKLVDGSHDMLVPELQRLVSLSGDLTFASEFISLQGLQLIIKMVESES